MKALVTTGDGSGLALVDHAEPELMGDRDVKIRVQRTGICGTDLHILRWDAWAQSTVRAPLVPGHEFSGVVVAVGSAVRDVSVGDQVSAEGHVVCGTCRNCRAGRRHLCIRTQSVGVQRDGAFAEYVVIPDENVWVHHAPVSPALGAIFDPFGNAVHTALRFPVIGEDVLITGAGPIGIMATAVARHAGARHIVVTDVSRPRLDMAERVGADRVVDVSSERIADIQRELGMREGFDIGLEISGSPSALPEMIANMNHGASIAMLGLPAHPIEVDWATVVGRMLTISGIYGRQMFETWNTMSAMLQTSPTLHDAIEGVITDELPASEWRRGFDIAAAGRSGKVILDWTTL
ncbi:L-threonine 3-dehydrogenase [Leifsonia sp. 21MFCrub1.1]|uniref:L-threonine 3-dehydrogenase n=1 Tax=Leifsonia sp. 21MFCrub1.1 TaxID=1798223 RepID=UPI00089282E0|nr:L-threonine 3-dehydrogenase [Leifsonia sp. 21MFCrub1.1]SEB07675.1 L-threonine 3-dehydrogenase [Leifsonia sp. 21MFCrub1.1]